MENFSLHPLNAATLQPRQIVTPDFFFFTEVWDGDVIRRKARMQ